MAPKKYVFNQELLEDSYIAITLAWDREVTFSDEGATVVFFESGDEFNGYSERDADDVINDLDPYLMTKGSTSDDPLTDAIWSSAQDFMPLEHVFAQIPATDEYEIWVVQDDNGLGGGQEYAIAWWGVGTGPLLAGDFDNDNDVDGADFLTWQRNPTVGSLTDREDDFGSTGALATANVVPEPATWRLLFVGLFVPWTWRDRLSFAPTR